MGIYELWYEFLKRAYAAQKYNVNHRVHSLLGDLGEPFDVWWEDHCDLFERQTLEPLRTIESAEEYDQWCLPGEPDQELVVSFNMYCSKPELIEAFSTLLDEVHLRPRGRPAKPEKMAEFDIETYESPTALAKTLAVYDLYITTPPLRPLELYEIGERLSLKPDSITNNKDEPAIRKMKQRDMTKAVRRQLDWADKLMENVIKGIFPLHSK